MPSRHHVRAIVPKKATECTQYLQELIKDQQLSFTLDEYSKGEHSLFW